MNATVIAKELYLADVSLSFLCCIMEDSQKGYSTDQKGVTINVFIWII
jgi:hypothetical protein